MTDHSRNFSRTYESDSDTISSVIDTDFRLNDLVHIGGLPDGVMVGEIKFLNVSLK